MIETNVFAYDFAVKNKDGVTIYYEYTNDGKDLSVTNDGGNCYSGSVVIPEEVTYMNRTRKVTNIGWHAFFNCENLISVTIPSSVIDIGPGAFNRCNKLTNITLPSSLKSIGQAAFEHCKNLKSIKIPDSVTAIDKEAFGGCTSLKSVTLSGNLKCIRELTFASCKGLTSITIPSSVTSIEWGAFGDCDIAEVISNNVTPLEINVAAFSNNTIYNATLYVPAGSLDYYKNTAGWSKFTYIEEGLPTK